MYARRLNTHIQITHESAAATSLKLEAFRLCLTWTIYIAARSTNLLFMQL
jgi:hypothetical protein